MDWLTQEFNAFLNENPYPKEECEGWMSWGGSTPGTGNGMYGRKRSTEWKEHMSEIMTGESNPFYGKKHSLETRQKMSASAKKRNTEEFKEKQRARFNHQVWRFLTPEGECVIIEGSLNKWCRENDMNTGAMCQVHRGNKSQYKGWTKYG